MESVDPRETPPPTRVDLSARSDRAVDLSARSDRTVDLSARGTTDPSRGSDGAADVSAKGSDRSADLTARLDRLRRRPAAIAASPPRAVLAWSLTAVLLAFALGLIANPWFERSVRSRLPGFAPTLTPTRGDVEALEARIAVLEARPAVRVAPGTTAADPALGERVARIEGAVATLGATGPAATARTDKLTADLAQLTARVDSAAATSAATLDSATQTAARAEAMLVAGAVRRQLAAGARLGALEPALRRDFGARAPTQVEAVAALGMAPVTAAGLRAQLAQLRPVLTGNAAMPGGARDWWTSLREGLAGVVVRPAAGSATTPVARVDRALADLTANNIAAAAAEIAALPPTVRAPASGWLVAADRYQTGWRALAAIEAMLLDPLMPAPAGAR